jgi:integrase
MKISVRMLRPPNYYVLVRHRYTKTVKKIGPEEQKALDFAQQIQSVYELLGEEGVRQLLAKEPTEPSDPGCLKPVIPTLAEYSTRWLAQLPNAVEYTTLKCYQLNVKYLVSGTATPDEEREEEAALGHLPLNEITHARMKAFIMHMLTKETRRRKTFGKHSIRLMVATARALFNDAIRDGILVSNPTSGLSKFYRKARVEREEIQPFTLDEMHGVECAAARESLQMYALVMAMSRTGARIGEVFGLQWNDIDFRRNVISISRNLPSSGNGDPSEPKTKTSIRSIPLNSELRSVLVDLKNRPHRGPWIFSDSKGNPLDYSVFLNKWHGVQKAAQVAIRNPHQTRHFFATELLSRGENLIEVSRMLGHASIAITVDVYAKWIPPARQAVVDVLNKSPETQRAVADLLSKRPRKSPEKSGKCGTQTIESSEISVLEKTLNQ